MDSSAKNAIKGGLLAFEKTIRFRTYSDPHALIAEVFEEVPYMAYYVHTYSLLSSPFGYELRPLYANKTFPKANIYRVFDMDTCIKVMRDAVEDSKDKIVIVANEDLDVGEAHRLFFKKYSPFFPNMTQLRLGGYPKMSGHVVYEVIIQYRIGRLKLSMMERAVDEIVENLAGKLFLPGMPNVAKAYLAHNYLASTVEYVIDHETDFSTSYTQSAYGAFVNHKCVCQGYAEAFKRLMDYAGIDCDVVSGQVVGSDGYHAWNIFATGMEDEYVHVDVTWDAATGRPTYGYFGKSDRFFSGKRVWDSTIYHACSGRYAVLGMARQYVFKNKDRLLANGVPLTVLDC